MAGTPLLIMAPKLPKLPVGMRIYAKYGVVTSDCPASMFTIQHVVFQDISAFASWLMHAVCTCASACARLYIRSLSIL